MKPKRETTSTDTKSLAARWGKDLINAGWTALPNVVFQNQKELGLKHLDVLILLHLASYWRTTAEHPWPKKKTIATALDVDPRTVQRSIKKMEDLGYIRRIMRKDKRIENLNLSNEYDLTGLLRSKKVIELAEVALKQRDTLAALSAEYADSNERRRATPLTTALTKEQVTGK